MMSKETSDTLGNQKKTNYALNPNLTREELIAQILNGLTPPPGYFPDNVLMNIQGYDSIDEVVARSTKALSPAEFLTLSEESDVIVLDTRHPDEFEKAFIPESINIGINGDFAVWVGTVFKNTKQKLILVAEEDRENEIATRLARIGFDNALGFLKGGINAWKEAGYSTDSIPSVNVNEMITKLDSANDKILDARRKSEFNSEHVIDAINAPLDYFQDNIALIPSGAKTYVHCAGGYRSMIFASLAKSKGYNNLINVKGGFKAIKENGQLPMTEYVCPTTLL